MEVKIISKVILKNKWENAYETLENRVWQEVGINFFLKQKKKRHKRLFYIVSEII